jgi:hypothetical protein
MTRFLEGVVVFLVLKILTFYATFCLVITTHVCVASPKFGARASLHGMVPLIRDMIDTLITKVRCKDFAKMHLA